MVVLPQQEQVQMQMQGAEDTSAFGKWWAIRGTPSDKWRPERLQIKARSLAFGLKAMESQGRF